MPIEVEVGDQVVEFPDGTSKDVIRAALLKRFGKGGITKPAATAPAKDDSVLQGLVQNLIPFAGQEGGGVGQQLTSIPANVAGFVGKVGDEASRMEPLVPAHGMLSAAELARRLYELGGQLGGGAQAPSLQGAPELAGSVLRAAGGPAVSAQLDPNVQEVIAALEKARTGGKGVYGDSPLKEAAVAGIPLVGPQITGAMRTEEEGRPSSAFGQLLGTITSLMAGGAKGKAGAAAAAGEPTTVAGAIRQIPKTAGQRAGSGPLGGALRAAEGVVSKSTVSGGATIFGKLRQQAAEAAGKAASMITEGISKFKGTDEELGVRITEETAAAKARAKEAASADYQDIDRLVNQRVEQVAKEVPSTLLGPNGQPLTKTVLTNQTVDSVMPQTAGLKDLAAKYAEQLGPNDLGTPAGNQIRSLLSKIQELPETVTFSRLQTISSELGDLGRSIVDPLPSRAQAFVKKIQSAAREAKLEAAGKSDIPGLKGMLEEADRKYKNYAETWDTEFWKSMARLEDKKAFGSIHRLLSTATPADIRLAKAHIPSKVFDAAVARNVGDVFEAAANPKGAIGADTVDKILKGGRTEATFGDARLREMLTPHQLTEIKDLTEAIRKTNPQGGSGLGKLSDGGIVGAIIYGGAGTKATALGVAGMMHVFAKIAVSQPGGVGIVRGFVNALNNGKPAQVLFWGDRLKEAAKASGADKEALEVDKDKARGVAAQLPPVVGS